MKKLVIALLTLASLNAQAEIREIKTMGEIIPAIDKNTLVVFDLDNTVIDPAQTLGSDPWFSYLVKKNIDAGMDEKTAVANAEIPWTQVQKVSGVIPVERSTPSLIYHLQKQGVTVMALTARFSGVISQTITQLRSVGVDFTLQPIYKENTKISEEAGATYVRGIVFLGSNGEKGHTLVSFLKQIRRAPPKIIFIDDKLKNVKNFEAALDMYPKLKHTSFRYGFDDEKVAHFNPVIAEIEWNYFIKYQQLMGDEEAGRIINQ